MAPKTKAKYIFAWLFITGVLYFSVQALVTHSYSFMTPLDGVLPFVGKFWPLQFFFCRLCLSNPYN